MPAVEGLLLAQATPKKIVLVLNKIDLVPAEVVREVRCRRVAVPSSVVCSSQNGCAWLGVSCAPGSGSSSFGGSTQRSPSRPAHSRRSGNTPHPHAGAPWSVLCCVCARMCVCGYTGEASFPVTWWCGHAFPCILICCSSPFYHSEAEHLRADDATWR